MKTFYFILIILFTFTIPVSANSSEDKYDYLYVGAGVGFTHFDGGKTNSIGEPALFTTPFLPIGGEDVTAKGFIGYRFHKFFAIEAAFHRFGEAKEEKIPEMFAVRGMPFVKYSDTDFRFKTYSSSVSFLGFLAATKDIEVFSKIGFLYSSSKINNHEMLLLGLYYYEQYGEFNDRAFTVLLGTGAQMTISENIILRLEAEWAPDIVGSNKAKLMKKMADLNKDGHFIYDGQIGYDADIDILAITASIVWKF